MTYSDITLNTLDDILNHLATICINDAQQIVTAESCTGGLVAKLITDLAGSSQWFERGFVTYSNSAKQQMLGVGEQLLIDHGAVSEPIAKAMAEGALTYSQAQFSLAITGVAGPSGGTKNKPVGFVCFGWAYYDVSNGESLENQPIIVLASSQQFFGDRETIRKQSALFALQKIYEIIRDKRD